MTDENGFFGDFCTNPPPPSDPAEAAATANGLEFAYAENPPKPAPALPLLLAPTAVDAESAELPSAASPPVEALGKLKEEDEDRNENSASAPVEAMKAAPPLLALFASAAPFSPLVAAAGRLLSLVVVSPPSAVMAVSTTRSFDLADLK